MLTLGLGARALEAEGALGTYRDSQRPEESARQFVPSRWETRGEAEEASGRHRSPRAPAGHSRGKGAEPSEATAPVQVANGHRETNSHSLRTEPRCSALFPLAFSSNVTTPLYR